MSKKKDSVIRFGIRASEDKIFTVWRLWVQNNEIYLANAYSINWIKLSLHSSNKWNLRERKNREGFTVNRPKEYKHGITRGPLVTYLGGLIQYPFKGFPLPKKKDIFLYDYPKKGKRLNFFVLLVKKEIVGDALLEILGFGQLIGPLELKQKENIWLWIFEDTPSQHDQEDISKEKSKIEIKTRGGTFQNSTAYLVRTNNNNEIIIIEMILGHENIKHSYLDQKF